MADRILYVRLPCNPIFPIGVVYLADHVHKQFPAIEQRLFDLGTVPPLRLGGEPLSFDGRRVGRHYLRVVHFDRESVLRT